MMYASGMSEQARESRKNRSLLKTEGTGWDVGAAIRFLAGDEARWCVVRVVCPQEMMILTISQDDRSHSARRRGCHGRDRVRGAKCESSAVFCLADEGSEAIDHLVST